MKKKTNKRKDKSRKYIKRKEFGLVDCWGREVGEEGIWYEWSCAGATCRSASIWGGGSCEVRAVYVWRGRGKSG